MGEVATGWRVKLAWLTDRAHWWVVFPSLLLVWVGAFFMMTIAGELTFAELNPNKQAAWAKDFLRFLDTNHPGTTGLFKLVCVINVLFFFFISFFACPAAFIILPVCYLVQWLRGKPKTLVTSQLPTRSGSYFQTARLPTMTDYFKPWRRTFGMITLVVVCMFAAAWVRSFTSTETICIPMEKIWSLISVDGHFAVCVVQTDSGPPHPEWDSSPFQPFKEFLDNGGTPLWHWQCFGFHKVVFSYLTDKTVMLCAPCWSIVIPLTMLSAYLLLSKPRSMNRKKSVEPTPEKES